VTGSSPRKAYARHHLQNVEDLPHERGIDITHETAAVLAELARDDFRP